MKSSFFDKTTTNTLKGIFAIAVVLSHVCSRCGLGANIGLGPIYTALGYWSVSVFLFISGYGLMSRYIQIRGGYFIGFIRNRILPIYMLNVLLIAIYFLLKMALDIAVKPVLVLQSFLFGNTIVECGWYLQACLLFYLFFLWSFKYAKSVSKSIIAMTILVAVYCAIAYYLGLATTWYECSFTILAGMLARLNKDKFESQTKPLRWFLLLSVAILFAITFVLGSGKLLHTDLKIVIKMLSSITFALTIFMGCTFVQLRGKVLEWLGCHYLEIYVLQGVSILLADRYIGRENAVIYFTASIAFTLLLAAMARKPIGMYMKMFKTNNK